MLSTLYRQFLEAKRQVKWVKYSVFNLILIFDGKFFRQLTLFWFQAFQSYFQKKWREGPFSKAWHKPLAKYYEKSRPDPDSAWKKASFEVPLDRVPKFRLTLLLVVENCNLRSSSRGAETKSFACLRHHHHFEDSCSLTLNPIIWSSKDLLPQFMTD